MRATGDEAGVCIGFLLCIKGGLGVPPSKFKNLGSLGSLHQRSIWLHIVIQELWCSRQLPTYLPTHV